MALIKDITTSWASVGPLGTDESWQCRSAQPVLVTIAASTPSDADQGHWLTWHDEFNIPSGSTVFYRAPYGGGMINREAI